MEEKKKISLSTFFLILAIIVILAMGYFIYNEKINTTEKIADLNNQINNLESTVNSLQETNNNISGEGIAKDLDEPSTSKQDILSESNAQNLLAEKFETLARFYRNTDSNFEKSSEKYNGFYKVTNYDEVLNKEFSKKGKDTFKSNLPALIFFENGNAYFYEGVGGFSSYDCVENIENIIIKADKISAIVKTKHTGITGDFEGYRESQFVLVKSGAEWLIEEFDVKTLDFLTNNT